MMETKKAIELLEEMRDNCVSGDIYEDPNRYYKASALTLGIEALKKQEEVNDEKKTERRIIVVDTETTGLDSKNDELLQVSIIDNKGNKLYDSLFKPKATSWEAAMAVNNITPEMVEDAPNISEKMQEITEIMYRADEIIGYNTNFDLDFLRANGLVLSGTEKIIDVMQMFKKAHGINKWVKLTEAAAHYGFDWESIEEKAHNSLGDCCATLFVYDKLKDHKDYWEGYEGGMFK